MPDLLKKNENIFARLTRLFRNGPIVRHKVASSSKIYEPQGTARAYKKELSNLYVNSLASYGQYERLARYADYSEMEYTPEIASALDIYADEVTSVDENGFMIKIESENDEIKNILETLFFDILNIEFHLHSWVRNLCKYGDFVLFADVSESNGVLNMLPIPINEIEREEGYDSKNPFAVRFRWLTQGNMILENWQVIHFRLLSNDNFLPYGSSIIEPARRIWRQLILIEDAMLIYRIIRSPERRVFKIEIGNIKSEEIPTYMGQVQNELKRNKVVNQTTGRVDLRYNPLSVDEDYFLPVRDGKGSSIETLPGGQFTGDIEDVQYIQSKLFAALKIPKSYLGYEGDVGSKATLAQEDVRFSRTIQRIQKIVLSELTKIAVIHLFMLGYSNEDLIDYEIKMANPSTIAEQQKLELWRTKLEIAGTAQEGMLSKDFIWKKIFGLSNHEVTELMDGMKSDKLFQLELDGMQLETDAGAEGEALPGEEDLPTSLDQAGSGEDDTQIEDSVQYLNDDIELSEDGDDVKTHNPGSEGDDASISVSKGKDLFKAGEDLGNHVFGTEKQTASDPFDIRYMNRFIRRPFSESSDDIMKYISESKKKIELVNKRVSSMPDLTRSVNNIKLNHS